MIFKHRDNKGVPNPFMRDYGQKPDVTVLKTGNKLAFKCKCGCEFVVSQRFCETELTGEFSFSCPECKSKCLHE